jgi:hypothetical protein
MRLRNVSLLLLVFSGLFFLQLPLSDSLPGKLDSWFYVSTYEYILGWAQAHWQGLPFGNSLYPENSHLPFGNFSVGMGLVYMLPRVMGLDVIWSFYVLTVLVYWTNALFAMLLAQYWKVGLPASIFVGFFTAYNNYTLSNLDNLDGLCWGPGLFALCLLGRFLNNGKLGGIWIAAGMLGLQLYFSSYMFLLSGMVGLFMVLFSLNNETLKKPYLLLHFIGSVFLGLLLISPFLYLYLFFPVVQEAYNPAEDPAVMKFTGLHLLDLFTYLPKTVYSMVFHQADADWYSKAHCAGVGILFPIFGLWGLFRWKKNRLFLILLLIVLLILAIGPIFFIHNWEIPGPSYPIMEGLGLRKLFRINIRAWLPVIFLLALGVGYLMRGLSFRYVVLIGLLAVLENLPISLPTYESKAVIERVIRLTEFPHISAKDVVLHLPSSFYSSFYEPYQSMGYEYPDVETEVLQEYSYMLHQAWTGSSTINGFVAFIPRTRMKNQRRILRLENALEKEALISENQISYVLIHKWAIQNQNGWGSEKYFLEAFHKMEIVQESDEFILIRI